MLVKNRVDGEYVRTRMVLQLVSWMEAGYTTAKEIDRFSYNLQLLSRLSDASPNEFLPRLIAQAEIQMQT